MANEKSFICMVMTSFFMTGIFKMMLSIINRAFSSAFLSIELIAINKIINAVMTEERIKRNFIYSICIFMFEEDVSNAPKSHSRRGITKTVRTQTRAVAVSSTRTG